MLQREKPLDLKITKDVASLNISDGKIPPNAVDMERLVLGSILIDSSASSDLYELLFPDLFYDPKHQMIYAAMVHLQEKGDPIDIITVIQALKSLENLSKAGGEQYIIDLSLLVSSSAHSEYHSRIIIEKYILRQLITISVNVIDESYKQSADVFDLLDKSEREFFDITNKTLKKGFLTSDNLVQDAIEKIGMISKQEGVSGVPTGFHKLDELTGGWQNSDLIIIAARPAMGKTAFLLTMARNMCIDYKMPTAIFSLEMSAMQLITRLISSETGIKSDTLRKGNLTDAEWKILGSKTVALQKAPLYIDETPSLSVYDFRAKCRRLVMQHDVKIIMVDYLQLMTANNGQKSSGNREQEISTISRTLKAVAKELNVPIIALSQLSRSVEARAIKRPQLSDLRESGAIEQDADIVSFIYRPSYYDQNTWDNDPPGMETTTENQAELIIAKHRNGSTGPVRLAFFNELAKFDNLETNAYFGGGGLPNPFATPDLPKRNINIPNPADAFDMSPDPRISGSSMNHDSDSRSNTLPEIDIDDILH